METQRQPKYLLTVRVKDGLVVRDTPRSQSDGGLKVRTEPVGKVLKAYEIIYVGPVPYAQLVPQNPLRSEWVRVREADSSVVYVDVEDINPPPAPPPPPPGSGEDSNLVEALRDLTSAIRNLVILDK